MRSRLAEAVFARADATPLALARIALGTVLLIRLATLCLQFETLFAIDGPLGGFADREPVPLTGMGRHPIFHWHVFSLWKSDAWTWTVLAVYAASLVAFTLGWRTRIATVLAYLLSLSLQRRVPIIWVGGDRLLVALLFWLVFAPTGACLSLDARRRGYFPEGAPAWSLFFPRAQVALVYLATAIAKLGSLAWLDGTAVGLAWRMRPFVRPWSPGLASHEGLVAVATWGTLAFELAFPLLVWYRPLRPWVLAAGVAFHLGIEATLRVSIFSWVMIASYALFLDPDRQPARWIAGRLSARASPQGR